MNSPIAAIAIDHAQANYELAVLRLHLAVGMSVADGTLDDTERAHLRQLVVDLHVDTEERARLDGVLVQLLDAPPLLEDLLRALIDRITTPAQAQLLTRELIATAHVDGAVDPREEGLLRLVCGALQIDPLTLYDESERAAGDVTAADLTKLVHSLLARDE